MLNVVTINPPSLEIAVGGSGVLGVKSWFTLEDAAIRFDGFPADAEVVQAWAWSQQATDYPAGCYGDMTWATYSALYAKLSGVPAQERCQPIGLGYLGRLLFRPGADLECDRQFFYPIPYRPGDKIGMFFEVGGAPGRAFSLFTGIRVRSATGFVELPGIVYHDLINRSEPAAGAFSFRSLIASIPEGGTEARVTVQSLAHPLVLDRMSIGVRADSSGFNMAATPVPVTFGGATTLNPGAYKTVRSDWVALNTTDGCDLLVHSCLSGGRPYKNGSNPVCYVSGISGCESAAFSGAIEEGTTHTVAMIEVR